MVLLGFSDLKTKLPATNTSAPASNNLGAFSEFTPPSISIFVEAPWFSIMTFRSLIF